MNYTHRFSYIPALDGIRAISILLVFAGHQGFENLVPGGLGVSIFFFISGFLITGLLFSEQESTGTISLKYFYIRRLLRLYPALLFMLVVLTVYLLLVQQTISGTELLAAIFYFENYHRLFINPAAEHYWILWSLAIEEHFYLLFPFLFLALVQMRKWLVGITAGLIILSLLLRVYTVATAETREIATLSTAYLTHNRFDSILIGCLASMILQSSKRERFLQFAAHSFVYALAVVVILFTLVYRDEVFRQTLRYSLQGACLLVLVPPVVYHHRYKKIKHLLSIKPVVLIGKLSYAIYLFHWVSAVVFRTRGVVEGSLLWILGNTVLTLLMSLLCYYGVEKLFLGLRRRYSMAGKQPGTSSRAEIKVVSPEAAPAMLLPQQGPEILPANNSFKL